MFTKLKSKLIKTPGSSVIAKANFITRSERNYLYFTNEIIKKMLVEEHITKWEEHLELEADEADEWVSYDVAIDASADQMFELNDRLVEKIFERNALNKKRSVCVMFRLLNK